MTQATLDRARNGDHEAFATLVGSLHRELHVHCYRMLGSVTDAEDLLQETLTAAWRGIGGLADPAALRAWLYRIATNRRLNAIRSHKRRPPPSPDPAFAVPDPSRHREVTWLQPYPDAWLAELPDPSPGPATHVLQADAMRLASSRSCSICRDARPPRCCWSTCCTSPGKRSQTCSTHRPPR